MSNRAWDNMPMPDTQVDSRLNRRSLPFNSIYVVSAIAIADLAIMSCFYMISFYQAQEYGLEPASIRAWKISDGIFCVALLYMMLASGSYRVSQLDNPTSQISYILVNGTVLAVMDWAVLWSLGMTEDFEWPLYGPINTVSIGAICMGALRLIVYQALVRLAEQKVIARSIAIVGSGTMGQRLIAAIRERQEPWSRIIGVFDDRQTPSRQQNEVMDVDGTVADLIEFSRENRVDEILVALPWNAEKRLLSILERLKVIPANVRLAPDGISHHFLDAGFGRSGGVPVYNIYRKPIGGWGALLKRIEDVVFGSALLLCASPVMLLCALAIKIDSRGPILFCQPRYGYNNKLIGVYKFRSMRDEMRDENCEQQTTKGDPRITRVGAFLRRTSLDELPQLFNVLAGSMSLVGPRPHATGTKAEGRLFEEIVHEYAARHRVKPGITGWAQVMGWRGETDTELKIRRRVECDLYYMEHWSLFLDIEIVFRTIPAMMGKNVY